MKILFSILFPFLLWASQCIEEKPALASSSNFQATFIGSDVILCEGQCADFTIDIAGGSAPFDISFFANNAGINLDAYSPGDVFRICYDESVQGPNLFQNESPVRLAVPEGSMPYTISLNKVVDNISCEGMLIPGGPYVITANTVSTPYTADIPRYVCDSLVLPPILPNSLTVNYYSAPGGSGDIYLEGAVLDFNNINLPSGDLLDTLYLFDPVTPGCGEQIIPFTINQSPNHFSRRDTALCNSDFTLPLFPPGPLTTGAATYADDINFTPSSILPVGTIINSSTTIYIADTTFGLFGGECVFLDSFDVRIANPIYVGEDSTHVICVGGNMTIPNFADLIMNPDPGGSWTTNDLVPDFDPLNTTNVDLSGLAEGEFYTFFYSIENSPCPIQVTTLIITAEASASSGDSGTFDICAADSPLDLIALLNEPMEGGNWFQLTGGMQIDVSDPRVVDFTQLPEDTYILDYEAPPVSTNSCPTLRATLTINLNAGPNAGGDNTAVVCRGDTLDLSTLLSSDADMGGIYTVEGFSIPDSLWLSSSQLTDPTAAFIEVLASYILPSSSANCEADTAIIMITLLQNPSAGVALTNPIKLCKGTSVNLNTLLQDATPNGQFYLQPGYTTPINNDWIPNADIDTIAYITPGTINCPPDTSFIAIEAADLVMADFMLDQNNLCKDEQGCVTGTFILDREAILNLNISDTPNGLSLDYTREKFDQNTLTICYDGTFGDIQNDTLYIGQATRLDFEITTITDPDYGCDGGSLLSNPITLAIYESYEITKTGTVCEGYTTNIDGIEYGASVDLNPGSINGCDSIIHIIIDTIALDTGMIVRSCLSDTLNVLGMDFTRDTLVFINLPGQSFMGCDSMVLVDLDFSNLAIGPVDTFACIGSNLMINNQTLDENNLTLDLPYTPGSFLGCDSLIRYTLRFYPEANGTLDTTICAGDTFIKGLTTYGINMPSGDALLQNQSANGCDSLLSVTVTFIDEIQQDTTIHLCAGETIIINGQTYGDQRLSGTETLAGSNGSCDTLLNITIDELSATIVNITDDLCAGGTFELNGTIYDDTNTTAFDTLISTGGCDSIIYNIDLNLINIDVMAVPSAACDSDGEGSILFIINSGLQFPVGVFLDGSLVAMAMSSPIEINTSPGSYMVDLFDDNCSWSESIDILIANDETLSINATELGNNTFQLGLSSTLVPAQISWSPIDILDCTDCPDPIATLSQETTINAEITTAAGCTQMATLLLPYEEIIPDSTILIYRPNTIDFNIPGNDIFYVQSNIDTNISALSIYDRWGNLVFSNEDFLSNAKEQGWNGLRQSRRVEPGVYVYVIRYGDGPREELVSGQLLVL